MKPLMQNSLTTTAQQKYRRLGRAATLGLVSLLSLGTGPAWSNAIDENFTMSFSGTMTYWDGSGTLPISGTGAFTIDRGSSYHYGGGGGGGPFDVVNLVMSFSADIGSFHRSYNDMSPWWWWANDSGTQSPGQLTCSHYGCWRSRGMWSTSYDSGEPQTYLTMFFSSSDPYNATGTWDNTVQPGDSENHIGYNASGTFTANAPVVPVPAAVWLFGSAMATFGALRRRKNPPHV